MSGIVHKTELVCAECGKTIDIRGRFFNLVKCKDGNIRAFHKRCENRQYKISNVVNEK